jgi:hypothetical protein
VVETPQALTAVRTALILGSPTRMAHMNKASDQPFARQLLKVSCVHGRTCFDL